MGNERLDARGAGIADTPSKHTHVLISPVGQPAAPHETNNCVVITRRQLTKEQLAGGKSRDFTTERSPHSIHVIYKGFAKEGRRVASLALLHVV